MEFAYYTESNRSLYFMYLSIRQINEHDKIAKKMFYG